MVVEEVAARALADQARVGILRVAQPGEPARNDLAVAALLARVAVAEEGEQRERAQADVVRSAARARTGRRADAAAAARKAVAVPGTVLALVRREPGERVLQRGLDARAARDVPATADAWAELAIGAGADADEAQRFVAGLLEAGLERGERVFVRAREVLDLFAHVVLGLGDELRLGLLDRLGFLRRERLGFLDHLRFRLDQARVHDDGLGLAELVPGNRREDEEREDVRGGRERQPRRALEPFVEQVVERVLPCPRFGLYRHGCLVAAFGRLPVGPVRSRKRSRLPPAPRQGTQPRAGGSRSVHARRPENTRGRPSRWKTGRA